MHTTVLINRVNISNLYPFKVLPGPVAQSVASPIADPEVLSSITAWPDTFMEIMKHFLLPLIPEELMWLAVTSESMCNEVLVNR